MRVAKTTKTAEQVEWESTREERERWLYRHLNDGWRETVNRKECATVSPLRRLLFPWRVRVERLR
jgi:hypothetical protein